jgi:hypothetical protein
MQKSNSSLQDIISVISTYATGGAKQVLASWVAISGASSYPDPCTSKCGDGGWADVIGPNDRKEKM